MQTWYNQYVKKTSKFTYSITVEDWIVRYVAINYNVPINDKNYKQNFGLWEKPYGANWFQVQIFLESKLSQPKYHWKPVYSISLGWFWSLAINVSEVVNVLHSKAIELTKTLEKNKWKIDLATFKLVK